MLSGKKILLSTVEEKNLEQLRQWRNEPSLRRYFREYREISRTMQAKLILKFMMVTQRNLSVIVDSIILIGLLAPENLEFILEIETIVLGAMALILCVH